MRRMMTAVAVIVLAAVPARAQDLPKAEDVFKKHVEAIGGKEAFKALKSMHIKGTFETMGIKGDLEVFAARPNKHLLKLSINGMVLGLDGYDGKVAWATNPMAGPSVKTGKELEEAKEEANFDSDLFEPGSYKAATVVSKEAFEGKDCYKVKIEYPSGRTVQAYFDAKSGLQIGQESKHTGGGASVDVTVSMAEYKKFGKISMPTRISQKVAGQELPFTITTVTFDDVDDKTFELPAEIKGLLKK